MNDDDFKTLRRYTAAEVVAKLRIRPTWLKRWVSANAVPHQRSGTVRGVWFTYDDILAIGRMLPTLMTDTQANGRAQDAEGAEDVDGEVRIAAAPPLCGPEARPCPTRGTSARRRSLRESSG